MMRKQAAALLLALTLLGGAACFLIMGYSFCRSPAARPETRWCPRAMWMGHMCPR